MNITPDVALRILQRRCDRAGVELILPDDPRRLAVVGLVAAAHKIQGSGVTFDHVREGVTITLPGVPGVASTLLGLIPVVGTALGALGAANGRTSVYLSPAAMADGVGLLATIMHELGHAGDIKRGGLGWCLAYLVAPEVRAGGEAPCYGTGMAVRHVVGGEGLDALAAEALASLGSYGLDADALALARGIVASAVETIRATGDHGGVVAELRAELAIEGVLL